MGLLGERGRKEGRGDDDVFKTFCKFLLGRLGRLGAEILVDSLLYPTAPGSTNEAMAN